MKIVEKWAVSTEMFSVGEINTEEVKLTLRDVQLFDQLEDIDTKNDKQFTFRLFQIQHGEEVLDSLYFTVADAEDRILEIEHESMTDEELFEYLKGIGYDILFNDGTINSMVAGEMAANEGIKYDAKLNRWFW